MKATLKKRITGQLKFLGFITVALWMVAVTGCKKHEILEPKPKAHFENGESKGNSASQRLGVYSMDSNDVQPGLNLSTNSDDNAPSDDMITDHDGNDDDGDGEGGDTKSVIDKDGSNDDEDGENNRITDKDSTDDDRDGEGLKQDGN